MRKRKTLLTTPTGSGNNMQNPHRDRSEGGRIPVNTHMLKWMLFLFLLGPIGFYLLNPTPFWNDESALALNVIERSALELFHPLDHGQTAPIGFLLLTKLLISVFGLSDSVFRIVPALFFSLLLASLYRSTDRPVNQRLWALLSISVFYYLFLYAFEFKQYIADAAVLVWLYSISTTEDKWSSRNVYALLLLSWFSNIALLLGPIFIAISVIQSKSRLLKTSLREWIVYSTIALNFCIYYLAFIHNHPLESYMKNYWSNYFPTGSNAFYFYFKNGIEWINTQVLGLPYKYAPAGFNEVLKPVFLGLILYFGLRKQPKSHWILYSLPLLFVLTASLAGKYPFHPGRLGLFLVAPMVFLTYRNVLNLLKAVDSSKGFYNIAIYSLILVVFFYSQSRILYAQFIDPKEALSKVIKSIVPEDQAWILGGVYQWKMLELQLKAKSPLLLNNVVWKKTNSLVDLRNSLENNRHETLHLVASHNVEIFTTTLKTKEATNEWLQNEGIPAKCDHFYKDRKSSVYHAVITKKMEVHP